MAYTTDMYEGMIAETTTVQGHNGDSIGAYVAKPLGSGPFPGMVLIHHAPGWDEFYRETARRFAHHGYVTISPNLYHRTGHGDPTEVAGRVRESGGISDDQALGDIGGALRFLQTLPNLNGKVGVFGTCSGGRLTFLSGCRIQGFSAAVECWGGRVVASGDELTANQPVAPFDYTADLSCPLLGLFGNDDQSPTPGQVDLHEEELKRHNKSYEFHRYDGAGHGFFYYDRAMYRQEQAVDGWNKVFAFLENNLG